MNRPAPRLRSMPWIATLAALACCPALPAQPAKPFTLEGKLTKDDAPDPVRKDSRHKVHELDLTKGRAYLIELSSKDFDTYLRVEDGEGAALAENDDAGPEDLNSRLGLVPPQTGKYRAVVTSFKGGQTGAYRLAVHELERLGAPLPVAGKLTKESPKNQGRHFQNHGAKLKGGTLYLIEMEGKGFTPSLLVGDGRGLLTADFNKADARRARAVFVAESAGIYRLTAVATKPGATGAYWITVQAYEVPKSLASASVAVGEGAIQPIQSRLTADDPLDRVRKRSHCKVHEVKLEAGQQYRIDLTSRDFDTYLRLEDKDGKTLDENDDVGPKDLNSRLLFTPAKTDSYRLVVTTYEAQRVGAYRLTVRGVSAAKE